MKNSLIRTPYGVPVENAVLPAWQTRRPIPDDSNPCTPPRAASCVELVWNFVKVNGSHTAGIECFLTAKITGVKKSATAFAVAPRAERIRSVWS
ncbi:hypothetical protein E1N52_26285 [Paraburkholderia guartelaensis]|uniref:Uncharacterized protein n=1 Tax=Paraburkholderia guartelaensis TaxID=2546446 RepID=A0A4R5L8T0_9BURK|nr:hypothetical protein [Paraburkholderia guartelaensis]TDG05237.1 hypothetical protein E1N52_26285 [Paraburkholderia guartelaensis]